MRIMLFFDLPRDTHDQRAAATKFVKKIKEEGFMMLQESVYTRLLLNPTAIGTIKARLQKIKPKEGNIMMLIVTEKQFGSMEYLLGQAPTAQINSTDRLVII